MRCAQCDNSLSRRARFCLACGTPVQTLSPVEGVAVDTSHDGPSGRRDPGSGSPLTPDRSAPGVGALDQWLRRCLTVIGAGLFLSVVFLFARSLSGPDGASSPEDAVQDLADAISGEDMAGTLAVIAPDEASGVLAMLMSPAPGSGAESDINTSLADLGDLDLEIDDLRMTTRLLGPGLVQVEIQRGTLSWSVPADNSILTGAASALGVPVSGSADIAEFNSRLGLQASSAHPGAALYVIALEGPRGWFLSPLYTVAEYATQYLQLPGGNFAVNNGTETTIGAITPDAAFNDLIAAARTGPAGILNHIAATSLPVLRAYESAAASLVNHLGATDAILQIETSATPSFLNAGEQAKLTLGVTSVGVGDRNRSAVDYFSFDGACLSCLDTGFETLADLLGVDTVYVIAERTPNGWIISPLATVAAYANQMIQAIEINPLAAAFDLWQFVIPDGAAQIGGTTDVVVNDYGFAVYSVQLQAGQSIYVSAREEFGEQAYAAVVDPKSGILFEPRELTSDGEFLRADLAGEYNIIVGADGLGTAQLQLTVSDISREQAPVDTARTLDLGPGRECADTVISPEGHPYLVVSTIGDTDKVNVRTAGVDEVGYTDSDQVLRNSDDSDFTLRACLADGVDSASIEMQLVPLTLDDAENTLDGGSGPVTGSVASNGSLHTVTIGVFAEGTDVTVTPMSGDADLVIRVYDDEGDEIDYADSGFGGDPESIYLYERGTTYTILITDYSGEVGAGYTIELVG